MKDLSHLDISWDNVDPCLWSIVENGIGKLSSVKPQTCTSSPQIRTRKLSKEKKQASSAPVSQPSDPYTPAPSAVIIVARTNIATAARTPPLLHLLRELYPKSTAVMIIMAGDFGRSPALVVEVDRAVAMGRRARRRRCGGRRRRRRRDSRSRGCFR